MARIIVYSYPSDFIDLVLSQKFYFTEKSGPDIRATMHKGEDFGRKLREDRRKFLLRFKKAKRRSTKEKINKVLGEIRFLIKLFRKRKKKFIFKGL